MFKKVKDFFFRDKGMHVVIGNKKCKVAQPTALRYYKLTELLELPDSEKILKLQSELESKTKEYAQGQSDELRQEIMRLDKAIREEMTKHSLQVQSMFKASNYAVLKEIVNTVCEEEVSEDDLKNCFEVQVAIAVDFFLALRMKTLNFITRTYTTYAIKNLNS